MQKVESILAKNPEAYSFVSAYSEYVHLVDDLIDEPKDIEYVDKLTFISGQIFSSNYWLKNCDRLLLIEQLIHIIYFNSVQWEKSNEHWKQRDAKVLSHCGYYMLFAVLLLETKDSLLVQEISLEFMEKCHLEHLGDMSYETLIA